MSKEFKEISKNSEAMRGLGAIAWNSVTPLVAPQRLAHLRQVDLHPYSWRTPAGRGAPPDSVGLSQENVNWRPLLLLLARYNENKFRCQFGKNHEKRLSAENTRFYQKS
jgi:hypothetical protein